MRAYVERMADSSFNLSVQASKERSGFFVLHAVGPINKNTYPIFERGIAQILESKPEIVLFDLNEVNYVSFRRLQVLLKTIMGMNQRSDKIYLINLQPQIKNTFKIMNSALPEWVFRSRKQLEDFFDASLNLSKRKKYHDYELKFYASYDQHFDRQFI